MSDWKLTAKARTDHFLPHFGNGVFSLVQGPMCRWNPIAPIPSMPPSIGFAVPCKGGVGGAGVVVLPVTLTLTR